MAFTVCLCLSANCFSIEIDLLDYIILATQRRIIKTGAFALLLKVQSCKLYNNQYMAASTRIANTEIFVFIAVAVVKLLSRKVLFINRKSNRNGQELQIVGMGNFQDIFGTPKQSFINAFSICMTVPLIQFFVL